MKKLFITKLVFVFTTLLFVFAFEARADLVEEITKKYKLDPKNNPRHQCNLMLMLELNFDVPVFKGNHCKEDVCKIFTPMYHFNKKDGNWYGPGHSYLFYKKSSYEIIGRSLDPANYEELSDQDFLKYIEKETRYMIDITKHEKFLDAKRQWDREILFNQELKNVKTPGEKMKLLQKRNRPQNIFVSGRFNDGILRLADDDLKFKNITYIKTRGCYIDESNMIEEYLQKVSNNNDIN